MNHLMVLILWYWSSTSSHKSCICLFFSLNESITWWLHVFVSIYYHLSRSLLMLFLHVNSHLPDIYFYPLFSVPTSHTIRRTHLVKYYILEYVHLHLSNHQLHIYKTNTNLEVRSITDKTPDRDVPVSGCRHVVWQYDVLAGIEPHLQLFPLPDIWVPCSGPAESSPWSVVRPGRRWRGGFVCSWRSPSVFSEHQSVMDKCSFKNQYHNNCFRRPLRWMML